MKKLTFLETARPGEPDMMAFLAIGLARADIGGCGGSSPRETRAR
jgi:hypothetical protein